MKCNCLAHHLFFQIVHYPRYPALSQGNSTSETPLISFSSLLLKYDYLATIANGLDLCLNKAILNKWPAEQGIGLGAHQR